MILSRHVRRGGLLPPQIGKIDGLPTDVQRRLFEHAASGKSYDAALLKTRIARFLVLNKEFDADDDEITRTRKIRRRFVAEKYATVVEAFYSGEQEVGLTTEITYEDGRKAILTSTIAIEDVVKGADPARVPAYA